MSGGMKWDKARHRQSLGRAGTGWVRLTCGCDTNKLPALSNPDKWFCCHGWQRQVRK